MPESDLSPFSTAARMLSALRSGEVSAVDLYQMHLCRIDRLNPGINSIILQDRERALRDATAADQRRARGEDAPLLGLPMTVKESIDVEGLPTTSGVEFRRGHKAPRDALTVRCLRDAGAVVFGKTNVCVWLADYQGDNPIYGRTNNPWNRDRTSGGSTAGSAALAAGLTPLELGSDLGGSIRVPAAFCGLWGHKPSETLVPNSGHFPGSSLPNGAWAMSAQGPHGRSAEDVRLALDVVAGPDVGLDVAWKVALPPPRHQRLADYRVAVLPSLDWVTVEPEIVGALAARADQLRKAGAKVMEIAPPGLGDLREYHRLFRRMMLGLISAFWPDDKRQAALAQTPSPADEFHEAYRDGMRATAGDYLKWHGQREMYRAGWAEFFREWDVLLTPVTIVNAFPHTRQPNGERVFTIAGKPVHFEKMNFYPGFATVCGLPGTAFPAGMTRDGLPIGLQAIGPFLEDHTPLHFAALMEREFGGFQPPPKYDSAWA